MYTALCSYDSSWRSLWRGVLHLGLALQRGSTLSVQFCVLKLSVQCVCVYLSTQNDGSVLATGCYDGQARVWSKGGGLKATLTRHQGPVFAIKWSPNGSYLATGGVDSSVLIWDALTNEVKQELAMHKGWVGEGGGGEGREGRTPD